MIELDTNQSRRDHPQPTGPAKPMMPVEQRLTIGRILAALAVGLILMGMTSLAIRYTEMVTGRYVSHGVPPLPAFASLLLLSLLRPVLRKYAPRLAMTNVQMLMIYTMVAVSTVISSPYEIRAFLPHLVSMQYQGRTDPAMAEYARHLPTWLAPRDPAVIEAYYEGAPGKPFPWRFWIGPLFWWYTFLSALFIGAFSIVTLVKKRWIQEERLTFPLLAVPLAVTSDDWRSYGSAASRRTIFMLGFGVAAAYNGINILHTVYPPAPSISFFIPLQQYFVDRPWTPFGSAFIIFFLEAIGIGYFVPLEITFSIWFFYLLNRIFAVAGTAMGYDTPGFPFTQEQSAGGYIAMGLVLLWGLRTTLRKSLKRAFSRIPRGSEAADERWAWIGLIASALFVVGFLTAAGMAIWMTLGFFGILLIFVIVVARIRGETGVPLGFVYPYGMPREMLLNIVGIPQTIAWGGTGSFVLLSSLSWLSRHHFVQEHAAYQLDGARIAHDTRTPYRTLVLFVGIAFAVGLVAAFWIHLNAYYSIGSNMAGGGGGSGEFRAMVAGQEYQQMASRLAAPPLRSIPKLVANGGGFLVVLALSVARSYFLKLPLHPLGFVIATAYGESLNAWFAIFMAWLLKALILRFGGLPLYRRGIPFFLGLTIGHFLLAGVVWPILSLFIAPEASQSYPIYFAG
ncbi:MAG: hypothetical protein HUU17_04395 [Chthonomonadales bacterium]|nr:hypothetical protein [Chthonomonadales bacterium]